MDMDGGWGQVAVLNIITRTQQTTTNNQSNEKSKEEVSLYFINDKY